MIFKNKEETIKYLNISFIKSGFECAYDESIEKAEEYISKQLKFEQEDIKWYRDKLQQEPNNEGCEVMIKVHKNNIKLLTKLSEWLNIGKSLRLLASGIK